MCDVFLNPDDSYKCIGDWFSLGYGGNYHIGETCGSSTVHEQNWALVRGPEYFINPENSKNEPVNNPYPSIRAFVSVIDLDDIILYISCGAETEYAIIPNFYYGYVKYTIKYSEAPALCGALSGVTV
jgi:hypothetical protein